MRKYQGQRWRPVSRSVALEHVLISQGRFYEMLGFLGSALSVFVGWLKW